MKQKQLTFADRAKAIKKRFPKADWDALERRDMLKELRALRDEQEAFRQSMAVDNEDSDVQDFAPGGPFITPEIIDAIKNYGKLSPSVPTLNNFKTPGLKTNAIGQDYSSIETSPLPSLISAGASVIGDVSNLATLKNRMPKPVRMPRVGSTDINLSREREALGRSYDKATNIALANSRNISNPSNAYANQIGAITGLTDSLGEGLSRSYLNEDTQNAQYRNAAAMRNSELGAQEALRNSELDMTRFGLERQYTQNLFDTIPNAMRDYRAQASQDAMLNTLGKDYGLYQYTGPNSTWLQRHFAPRYAVLNRQNSRIKQ